jgi:hypothetical protein
MSMLSFPISHSLSHTYVCPNRYFTLSLSLSLSLTSALINYLSHTPPHLRGSSVRFSLTHDSSTPSSPLFSLSLAPLSSGVRIPTVPTFPLSEIDNLLSHQSLFNLLNQEDSYAQPLGVGLGDDGKEN